LELSQVRYFVTLCGSLNFTRAAAQCNVTQPAFSRAIQSLEAEFGGRLLSRARNMTRVTELGREILPHLTVIMNAADAAAAVASARRKREPLNLRIGLAPGIGAASISPAVQKVTVALSDVDVHFDEAEPAALIEAMLSDNLDCALLPEACGMPAHLNRWPLYTENAVAVLPAEHRLAAAPAIMGRDLIEETLLVGNRCGGFASHLAESAEFPLRLQRCNGGTAQMLDLVSAGLGVALLSEKLRFAPPLVVRKFSGPDLSRRVTLAAVAGRRLNTAAAQFVRFCRAESFA
jgi:DNA-binding transcriptional LysR family regulator